MAKIIIENLIVGPSPDGSNAILNIPELIINHGDRLGVIGINGAGKTTLLKVLSGALEPNFGSVSIIGKVQPLINIASGMDNNLTCEDNIKVVMAMRGLPQSSVNDTIDFVLAAAKISPSFAKHRLKNFSSGMHMNFALALGMLYDSEILLLDEFISARDARFDVENSDLSLKKIIERSDIMVLCSHSMRRIVENCNTAIFLNNGTIVSFDSAKETVRRYKQYVNQ